MIKRLDNEPSLKERAIVVASRLLRSNGYEATRLEDVAAELGVTAPALYWHFSSKSELFYEILKDIIERFNSSIDEAFNAMPDDPESVLRRIAEAHTREQLAGPESAQSYTAMSFSYTQATSWMTNEQAEALRVTSRAYFERLRDVIRRGIAEGVFGVGDPTVATFGIINVCEFSHLWYQPGKGRTIDQVAQLHGEFAVQIARGNPDAGPATV